MTRARVATAAALAVLALPAVLAFYSGGYFDRSRLWAGVAAWVLVVVALISAERALPARAAGLVAIAGLTLLAAWRGLSLTWTQTGAVAVDDVQRDVLYLGALIAAAALLRPRAVARMAEPMVVLGAVAAVGYGLSERVLPTVIDLAGSLSAGGRLELPLTYWNAQGALAVLGFVLGVRLAGDAARAPWLRCAGAASGALLGLGAYLTFSRGALLAAAVALVALVAFVPQRAQVRAAGVALGGAVLCAIAVTPLGSVRANNPADGIDPGQGAILLVALVVGCAGAALVQLAVLTREADGRLAPGRIGLPRVRPAVAVPLVIAVVAGGVALAATLERSPGGGEPQFGATAARFGSVESNRYAYWKVAVEMWADAPLRGQGSGTFRQVWVQERTIPDPARDAHSLYAETLGELGVAGLAALLMLLAGVAVSARRALRADRELAAGPAAAVLAFAAHAGLDWDWEMPALTLVALVLAGLLVAAGDREVSASGDPG